MMFFPYIVRFAGIVNSIYPAFSSDSCKCFTLCIIFAMETLMRHAIRNGLIIKEEEASLPVTLRSMQYAYSVYEALKLKNGEFVHLKEHLFRLRESARGIGITLKYSDEEISSWLEALRGEDNLFNETFRILLVGKENILFITHDATRSYPDSYYMEGVDCTLYEGERFLPNFKTSNLLLSYLALDDAESKGAFEALFVNRYGYVTEGTRSNFYALRGNRLYTAPDKDVLLGVTRIGVTEAAKDMGVEIVYEPVYVKDIFDYDSLFISSTSMKAMPIRSINGKSVKRSMNTMVLRFSDYVGAWE